LTQPTTLPPEIRSFALARDEEVSMCRERPTRCFSAGFPVATTSAAPLATRERHRSLVVTTVRRGIFPRRATYSVVPSHVCTDGRTATWGRDTLPMPRGQTLLAILRPSRRIHSLKTPYSTFRLELSSLLRADQPIHKRGYGHYIRLGPVAGAGFEYL